MSVIAAKSIKLTVALAAKGAVETEKARVNAEAVEKESSVETKCQRIGVGPQPRISKLSAGQSVVPQRRSVH